MFLSKPLIQKPYCTVRWLRSVSPKLCQSAHTGSIHVSYQYSEPQIILQKVRGLSSVLIVALYPGLPMFFNIREKNREGLVDLVMLPDVVWGMVVYISTLSPTQWAWSRFATWLTAWARGWRYTTAPQTASDYITRLTRPFQFSHVRWKTWEGLGTRLHNVHVSYCH